MTTSSADRALEVRRFRVGDRVQGYASKPTGALGTVRRVLKQSKVHYRVDWDNGGSSVCSPLSLVPANGD